MRAIRAKVAKKAPVFSHFCVENAFLAAYLFPTFLPLLWKAPPARYTPTHKGEER